MKVLNRTNIAALLKPRREKVMPSQFPTLPYIGMEHVEAHTMRLLGTVPASSVRSSANRFYDGDVLYGRLRPYLNKVLGPEFDGLCSAEFIVLPKTEEIESKFLTYRLNSADFVSFASHLNTGDRPRVDFDQFALFEIVLPSVLEQRRIVAEIEKQFTRLDAGVASLKRVQISLKRYRASVLKAACEGRLVPTEAELARREGRSYEPATQLLGRILKERRTRWESTQHAKLRTTDKNWKDKYKEPVCSPMTKEPHLPDGWCGASLDQLSQFITSGSRGWAEFYSSSGSLFIRAQDIKTDSLKMFDVARVKIPGDAEGTRSLVCNNDLLITITGANVTKSALVRGLTEDAYVSQHVALVRPVMSKLIETTYLWIVSPANGRKQLELWAYGAGKPGLNLIQLRSMYVAMAPASEQKRIVAEVDRRLSVVAELDTVVTANLKRAERLRQCILNQAFAGML